MSLIEATAHLSETHATRLPANYIGATLKDREQDTNLNAAFERALSENTCESKCALLRALVLNQVA